MVCITVLTYVFGGGMRSLSFANAVHATVLILLGGVILFLIVGKLGGADAASALVARQHPDLLVRGEGEPARTRPHRVPVLYVRASCRSACFRTSSSIG